MSRSPDAPAAAPLGQSVGALLKAQAATWFVGFVISMLAVFSSTITEHVKTALNSADLRSKYYEELAINLSAYVFQAEQVAECLDKGLTDADTMTPLITDYNAAITELRKKQYVYLSWIGRYWGASKIAELSAAYDAVKTLDAGFHSLNDEFEAVNVAKSKKLIDPQKVQHALLQLHPALQAVQQQTTTLLTDLQ